MTASCAAGSLRSLLELVDELSPASILLFTGGASYQASGAAALMSAATKGRPTAVISGVSAKPSPVP